jgi:hypothetical protein
LERIAKKVEILITQNPKAIDRFKKQIEVFNQEWLRYCKALKQEPSLFHPNPLCWEVADKLPCYYASLAVVFDYRKMATSPIIITEGILDSKALKIMLDLLADPLGPVLTEDHLDTALRWVKADLESCGKPAEAEQKDEGSKIMITPRTSKENWEAIRREYDISKKDFGKKIKFVSDSFKRKIIFRDVEHAFVLASQGFPKPSLILAGGVIEELLRLYLEHKNIPVTSKNFVDYIKTCEQKGLLKSGISKLSDSVREFRNLVHLSREETNRYTISKATAKGAVSSIFTIANDFQ